MVDDKKQDNSNNQEVMNWSIVDLYTKINSNSKLYTAITLVGEFLLYLLSIVIFVIMIGEPVLKVLWIIIVVCIALVIIRYILDKLKTILMNLVSKKNENYILDLQDMLINAGYMSVEFDEVELEIDKKHIMPDVFISCEFDKVRYDDLIEHFETGDKVKFITNKFTIDSDSVFLMLSKYSNEDITWSQYKQKELLLTNNVVVLRPIPIPDGESGDK